MGSTDKATVRALMEPVPVQLRSIYQTEGLLEKLDISVGAADAELRRGIGLLIGDSSGNYRIDEPFLQGLYAVMAKRVESQPTQALRVMAETPFPLEGMILRQPEAVKVAMSADIGLAAAMVRDSDAVISPPARIIHRLTFAHPPLAARLVAALDSQGQGALTAEALAYMAYDADRSKRYPQLPLSVSQDGAFLLSLLEGQGEAWLTERLGSSVALYRQRADAGDVPPNFLRHYRETLEAAAATQDAPAAALLLGIIQAAFGSNSTRDNP